MGYVAVCRSYTIMGVPCIIIVGVACIAVGVLLYDSGLPRIPPCFPGKHWIDDKSPPPLLLLCSLTPTIFLPGYLNDKKILKTNCRERIVSMLACEVNFNDSFFFQSGTGMTLTEIYLPSVFQ